MNVLRARKTPFCNEPPRILERLGESGMGVVWKAQDTRLERTAALKLLAAYAELRPIIREDRFYITRPGADWPAVPARGGD